MNVLTTILAFAACFFVLIAVHEFGHYLAGWLGGIPARNMRIRMFVFPQRVDLRCEDRWVSPYDRELFLSTAWGYLKTPPRFFLYTSGGLLLETLFAVVSVAVFMHFGHHALAILVAISCLCIFLGIVLVLDLPVAWYRGHPVGDVSGLWALAKLPTVVLMLVLLTVRSLLVWYVKT